MNNLIINQGLVLGGYTLVMISYILLGLSVKNNLGIKKDHIAKFMFISALFVFFTILLALYTIVYITPDVNKAIALLTEQGNIEEINKINEVLLF